MENIALFIAVVSLGALILACVLESTWWRQGIPKWRRRQYRDRN